MKKIVLTLGVLMIAILLTACGENLDTFELLELAHEAEADVDSMIIEMALDIEMFLAEQDRVIGMSTAMRVESESEHRWKSETSIIMEGQHHETTRFVRDGNEYIEERIDGDVTERIRSEFNDDDTSEDIFFTNLITEDMVLDSSAASTDDGYRLEFDLNSDGIALIFEELEFEGASVQPDLDEEEAHHTMVIYLDDDHRPTYVEIDFEGIDILFDGEEMILTLNLVIETVQFGNVTVAFPDWLDDEPISVADLVGAWTWDPVGIESDHFLYFSTIHTGFLFYKGGTMFDGRLGDDHLVFVEFEWELLNHNNLYLHFDASGETFRYEIFIEDDVLTRVNLDTGDEDILYFNMTLAEFSDFLDSLTSAVEVSEDDLVGVWTWEIGSEFLLFFDYDQTGILLDNTAGNMIIEPFTWELNGNVIYSHFEANEGIVDRQEIISLDGDVLTLLDLEYEFEFDLYFTMTATEFIEYLDALEDEGSEAEFDLPGTWQWESNHVFRLVFNEDGTGEWIGMYDEFRWETSGDELTLIVFGIPQRWHFEISGRNLIISSLDLDGLSYTYIRR